MGRNQYPEAKHPEPLSAFCIFFFFYIRVKFQMPIGSKLWADILAVFCDKFLFGLP